MIILVWMDIREENIYARKIMMRLTLAGTTPRQIINKIDSKIALSKYM